MGHGMLWCWNSDPIKYILDGGSLIHRIPWKSSSTFHQICNAYCTLVSNSYGLPCVVFDGYSSGPTIKDVAHERRSKGLKGNQSIFDRNTPFKSKKESFLSNIVNKQNFINCRIRISNCYHWWRHRSSSFTLLQWHRKCQKHVFHVRL